MRQQHAGVYPSLSSQPGSLRRGDPRGRYRKASGTFAVIPLGISRVPRRSSLAAYSRRRRGTGCASRRISPWPAVCLRTSSRVLSMACQLGLFAYEYVFWTAALASVQPSDARAYQARSLWSRFVSSSRGVLTSALSSSAPSASRSQVRSTAGSKVLVRRCSRIWSPGRHSPCSVSFADDDSASWTWSGDCSQALPRGGHDGLRRLIRGPSPG